MKNRLWKWVLVLSLVGARPGSPVTPTAWRDDTFAEFEKGKPDGVSISADGSISLAASPEVFAEVAALQVWCLIRSQGGTLYAGTGDEGKVFTIGPDRKVGLLCALPGAKIVHALALSPDGSLYAGTSPGGVVYRIPPGKPPALACSTGARYVWSLVLTPGGALHIATGGPGRVLRLDADGKANERLKSSDDHVISLLPGTDGTIYAGTEGKGLVYRIGGDGRTQVLYDAPEREVRGLALAPDGTLYAGAMTGAQRLEDGKDESPRPRQDGSAGEERSSLYRISPAGSVVKLWDVSQPLLLALHRTPEGRLFALTGDRGMLYGLGDDGVASAVARFEDAQPLALCPGAANDIFVGAGGGGKVYRLATGGPSRGTFTSARRDFSSFARWGKVAWRGDFPQGSTVGLQTRSGNVDRDDEGWSDWSAELTDPAGSQITSPPARFLQYRLRLTAAAPGTTPVVREVSAAGLQENLRPVVSALEVIPPGRVRPAPESGPPPPPRNAQAAQAGGPGGPRPAPGSRRGVIAVQWTATDPNGDDLVYTLYVRGVGDPGWRVLEKSLTTPSYTWNTDSVPDGTTLLKVSASDRPDNPEESALTAEKTCEPFEVDNTPPRVSPLVGVPSDPGTCRLEGSATDETGPLKSGEYALDGGEWRVFFPSDGIFDSRRESFGFRLKDLDAGEHLVAVRVTDAAENVGVAKVQIRVK